MERTGGRNLINDGGKAEFTTLFRKTGYMDRHSRHSFISWWLKKTWNKKSMLTKENVWELVNAQSPIIHHSSITMEFPVTDQGFGASKRKKSFRVRKPKSDEREQRKVFKNSSRTTQGCQSLKESPAYCMLLNSMNCGALSFSPG